MRHVYTVCLASAVHGLLRQWHRLCTQIRLPCFLAVVNVCVCLFVCVYVCVFFCSRMNLVTIHGCFHDKATGFTNLSQQSDQDSAGALRRGD